MSATVVVLSVASWLSVVLFAAAVGVYVVHTLREGHHR